MVSPGPNPNPNPNPTPNLNLDPGPNPNPNPNPTYQVRVESVLPGSENAEALDQLTGELLRLLALPLPLTWHLSLAVTSTLTRRAGP